MRVAISRIKTKELVLNLMRITIQQARHHALGIGRIVSRCVWCAFDTQSTELSAIEVQITIRWRDEWKFVIVVDWLRERPKRFPRYWLGPYTKGTAGGRTMSFGFAFTPPTRSVMPVASTGMSIFCS